MIDGPAKQVKKQRDKAPSRGGSRKTRNQAFLELAAVMDGMRRQAKKNGLDKMPMSEINRIVAIVRRDMKKESRKHVAK